MTLRLSIFYGTIFLAVGIMLPFWPVWLDGRGLSPTEIGVVIAAGMFVRAFTNPLLAQFADRSGRPDRLLAVMAWLALAAHLVFFAIDGFWPILLVSVVAGMAFSSMLPLGDAVTMLKVREGTVDYGRVRLWGSITFVLAAMAGGQFLTDRPTETILWLVIACLVAQLGAAHAVPAARSAGTARFGAPLIGMVRDRPFLVFLAAASLLQASHGVYYGFATLHWREAGYDEVTIGVLWAEGVVAEIALFAFSRAMLARMSPMALLGLAAAAGVVRWALLGLGTALPAIAAAQLLHALTFGAAHLAAMHHIARVVPSAHGATAQSLYSSFTTGMAMSASTLASGWLYARAGGATFFAMAAISLAGGIIVAALVRQAGRQAIPARSGPSA